MTMPCYTTTTVSVDVANWDAERAHKAISDAGIYCVYYDEANKRLVARNATERGATALINEAKRAYATATVKAGAARFGWRVKAQSTTKAGTVQLRLGR